MEALKEKTWPPDTQPQRPPSRSPIEPGWPKNQKARLFRIRDEQALVAVAKTFPREVALPNGRAVVMALTQVVCVEEYRGQGFGKAVVRAAFERVDRGDFPCAIFQCSDKNKPFYEKLGAGELLNPVINSLSDDPGVCPFWDDRIMVYPAGFEVDEGQIDTLGPGW